MRRVDAAWAAGFFDGEGWVGAPEWRQARSGIRASIAQKDVRALRRFRKIVGVGKIGRPGKSGVSYWYISREANVRRVYEILRPYIGPVKRLQFKTAFKIWNSRPRQYKRGPNRTHCRLCEAPHVAKGLCRSHYNKQHAKTYRRK